MNANEKTFDSLAGVPTHYARPPVAPYGTRGKRTPFACTSRFHLKLEACFSEIWARCPFAR